MVIYANDCRRDTDDETRSAAREKQLKTQLTARRGANRFQAAG